jgi:hypothetical protein
LFGKPLGKNRELSGVIGESGKIGKKWGKIGNYRDSDFSRIIPDNFQLGIIGNYRESVLAICFGNNQPCVCAPAKHCCSITPPSPIGDCGVASSTKHLCHH